MKKIFILLTLLFSLSANAQLVGVIASSSPELQTPPLNYSIENLSYSGKSFDPSTQTGTSLEDGTGAGGIVWIYGNGLLYEYTQSDSEDITTMSYNNYSLTNSQAGQYRAGIDVDPSGTKILGSNFGSTVSRIQLATPYNFSTYTAPRVTTSVSATTGTSARGWAVSPDGTKLYGVDTNTGIVYEFDVSPAWTGTPTYNSVSINLSAYIGNAYGMSVSPDGKYMIIGDSDSDELVEFEFGTLNDLTTLTATGIEIYTGSEDGVTYGGWYSTGGTRYNMIGIATDKVYQYNLAYGDLYPHDNSASKITEINDIGSWVISNGTRGELTSSTNYAKSGLYSLYQRTKVTDVGNVRQELTFTAEIGGTYLVEFWYLTPDVITDQQATEWTGINETINVSLTSSTWAKASIPITANSTSVLIRLYSNRSNAVLDSNLYIDDFSIRKTN